MTVTTYSRKSWTVALVATAVLLAVGLAAATLVSGNTGGGDTVVTAADGRGDSVRTSAEASALLRATVPSAPESTPEAVPVPVPTTEPPAPPVTEAPAPAPTPTVPVTVTAAPAVGLTMTLVSRYPAAVTMNLNGVDYALAPGQEIGGLTVGPQTQGNDILYLARVDDPSCGEGDADGYFRAGPGHYIVAVVPGRGICLGGEPGPDLSVTPS